MLYCPNCKVNISTQTDKCPLCHQALPKTDTKDLKQTYPSYELIKNRRVRWAKGISIASVVVIALSVLFNLLFWNGHLWSVLVSASVLYAWLLGLLTFKRSLFVGIKLLAHAVFLPLLLLIFNAFADDAQVVVNVTWGISYAMPAIFLLFIFVIDALMIEKRHTMQEYILVQLSLCVIGFVPLILVLVGLAEPIYMSIAVAIVAGITVLGLILFARQLIAKEFARKFHI